MRTVSQTAAKVLDTLTANMEVGTSRHIGEKGGAFMQVVVERLYGTHYSVSHYFEQNGDLCPDPDMEFYKTDSGAWLPINCTMPGAYTEAVRCDGKGKPMNYSPRALGDLCSFTTVWMRNIKEQQNLRSLPAAA